MLRIFQILSHSLLLAFVAAQLPAQVPKLTPDETKRAEKYARLRADYAASTSYNPQVPSQASINSIRYSLGQSRHDDALKLINALIAKNPVSAELYAYQAMAFGGLGKTAEAGAAIDAQRGIQDAILLTGDGASPDTAFKILNAADIQSVADRLGARFTLRGTPQATNINAHAFYVVPMTRVGARGAKACYFNIDAITAWQKTHSKGDAKSGLRGGVKIGAATVVGGEADDSMPQLVSTTGGGNSRAWTNFAALKKAADNDSPDALLELGQMYLDGSANTPRDTAQALFYLERAAGLGSRDANFRLGKLYADGGNGVRQDSPKAYGYYMAAARAGNPIAQYNVGAMLASGRGVKRDYAEGLAWLILAAKKAPEAVDGEKKLRHFLGTHPETIAAGEARAAEIAQQLAAARTASKPSLPELVPEKPAALKIDIVPPKNIPRPVAPLPALPAPAFPSN